MKIEFEPARFEIPFLRNGRPGYRWVDGVYVILNGRKIYPPMRIREAKNFVAEINPRAPATPNTVPRSKG